MSNSLEKSIYNTLPYEMKMHIFQFFKEIDLVKLLTVSKDWYRLILDRKKVSIMECCKNNLVISIRQSIDVDELEWAHQYALCRRGNLQMLKYTESKRTINYIVCLPIACEYGYTDIVKYLLPAFDYSLRISTIIKSLEIAKKFNWPEIINLLQPLVNNMPASFIVPGLGIIDMVSFPMHPEEEKMLFSPL